MDHLRELQGRLFSSVLIFVLVAAVAYPFFDKISAFLMAPLKEGQELVYLTPGGAFSFLIQVCAYIGLIGTLPVLIFHIYRFIMPAVKRTLLRTVLFYTIASMVLAVGGIAFAYYVSLPASLYFLTSFNLNDINPMLTIDAYFSFVMTYILAGAILFQLPLVMMIINSATPLTPAKLMKAQGKILIGSFIVAAIISPTPDALNQTLLASPMVVMYQVGILLIWWKNRIARKEERLKTIAQKQTVARPAVAVPVRPKVPTMATAIPSTAIVPQPAPKPAPVRSMDMVRGPRMRPAAVAVPQRQPRLSSLPPTRQPIAMQSQTVFGPLTMRSLDGVVRTRRVA